MLITAFSDTHGLHRKLTIPVTDILIFAGDAMTCGYKENELIDFLEWYNELEVPYKIMIAGNHDRYIENNRGLFLDLLKEYPTIQYLEDSGCTINEISFWGTPHSRHFMNWAFNRSEKEMEKAFSNIPDDIEILISHAPPFGILDKLEMGEDIGEPILSVKVNKLADLRYHIFGHVHCGYGQHKNGHISLNVSAVNEQYQIQNKPVTFRIYPHG